MDSFRQDDYACKRDAESIRLPAVGAGALLQDGRVRKMYIECMEAKGYSR
jgi:hypothetical protein